MSNLNQVLADISSSESVTRRKRFLFEKFIQNFFKKSPIYSSIFSNVWLWREYPLKKSINSPIDIVAQFKHNKKYSAILCKIKEEDCIIQEEDIRDFLTSSEKLNFSSRIILFTTSHWNKEAEKIIQKQNIVCSRLFLKDLEAYSIDWYKLYRFGNFSYRSKTLLPHQQKLVTHIKEDIKNNDKIQIALPHAMGKNLLGLSLIERVEKNHQPHKILFLTSSFSSLIDSLEEWAYNQSIQKNYCIACLEEETDNLTMNLINLAYPVIRTISELKKIISVTKKENLVIFSTYDSIDKLAKIQGFFFRKFDFIFYNNAHRYFKKITQASLNFKTHNIKTNKSIYLTTKSESYFQIMQEEIKTYALDSEYAVKEDCIKDYKIILAFAKPSIIHKHFNFSTERSK